MGLKLYLERCGRGSTLLRRNGVLAVDSMTTLEPNSDTHTHCLGLSNSGLDLDLRGPEGGMSYPRYRRNRFTTPEMNRTRPKQVGHAQVCLRATDAGHPLI